ncbi:MAG: DNA gyrase inhibitor YacG [Pseudomonadales bacterium]|nr:DNA gyrase inhibitor YacG [Pseudomonadales bacterium]
MANEPRTEKLAPCPHCDMPVHWSKRNPYRPFCSNRCRLIDLGAWLDGDRYIPGEPAQPTDPDET